MNIDEYQKQCLRTANQQETTAEKLVHFTLGLTSEAGEVATEVKRHVAYGRTLDAQATALEIGDIVWFACALADAIDYDMSEILRMNLEKLRKRYPGNFSELDAIARKDEST